MVGYCAVGESRDSICTGGVSGSAPMTRAAVLPSYERGLGGGSDPAEWLRVAAASVGGSATRRAYSQRTSSLIHDPPSGPPMSRRRWVRVFSGPVCRRDDTIFLGNPLDPRLPGK